MSTRDFRRARREVKDASGRKDWERRPWTADNFQMEHGERAAPIRIMDPGPSGLLVIAQHQVTTWGSSLTCTAKMDGFDGRCVACYYHQQAAPKSADNRLLYRRVKTVAALIDFRMEHEIEVPKKKGEGMKKVRTRCAHDTRTLPKGGRRSSRSRCKHCESRDPDVARRHFGGKKKWEWSNPLREKLYTISQGLAETAFWQEDVGSSHQLEAYTIGYRCGNCATEIVDEDDLRRMDDEERAKVANTVFECPLCTESQGEAFDDHDLPEEVWIGVGAYPEGHQNAGEEFEKGMDEPGVFRAGLYDKDIEVGVSTTTREGSSDKFREYSFDKSAFDFGPPEDRLERMGFTEDEIADLLRPMDVADKYRPQFLNPDKDEFKTDGEKDVEKYVQAVLESQARQMGRESPYKPKSSGGARPFQDGAKEDGFRVRVRTRN